MKFAEWLAAEYPVGAQCLPDGDFTEADMYDAWLAGYEAAITDYHEREGRIR